MVTRDYHGFDAESRPGVQVEIGGRWRPGELRAWIRRGDAWWAHVTYRLSEHDLHTATVPADRITSTDPRAASPSSSSTAS